MKILPFIQEELVEARMFFGPKDLKNRSAEEIASIVFLMIMMLEVIRSQDKSWAANYASQTLTYNTYESMHYSATDLGNLLAVLNNQNTFSAYMKTESNISIPLFQINRYLNSVKSGSNSGHSDDIILFWRLEDYLRLYSKSLLRQIRRDVGNWGDLSYKDKNQLILILRREFDKYSSSVDIYLHFKQSFKLKEDVVSVLTILEDAETDRLDINITGDWSNRVFFEAILRDDKRTWLDVSSNINCGSATIDLSPSIDTAYINRIDVHPTGNKFGPELLRYVITQIKEHGFHIIETYIESNNTASKSMFQKIGFKEAEIRKVGSTWILK